MIKSRLIAYCLFTLSPLAAAVADSGANTNGSTVEAAQWFLTLCAKSAPDLGQTSQIASAQGLRLLNENGVTKEVGEFAHTKQWAISMSGGDGVLMAVEANGGGGHNKLCSMMVPNIDGPSLRDEMIHVLNLGQPSADQPIQAPGARQAAWKDHFGPGQSLVMIYGTTRTNDRVIISRISEEPLRP